MPVYTLKLLDKKEIAQDTYLYVFSKPEGFTFIPGQFGGLTLPALFKTNPSASTRRFSILNIPSDNELMIATRFQHSVYKQHLNNLAIGEEVKFVGPSGQFILHEDQSIPAVFIAGGIGITPFYSMIKHAYSLHSSQAMYLFYGNQKREQTAFLDELSLLEKQFPSFSFIPTLAQPDNEWQGETGFISHEMIKKYVRDLSLPIFYICGAPSMVSALQETLTELDIPPEKIKVEDFPGY